MNKRERSTKEEDEEEKLTLEEEVVRNHKQE
jgi:hypothetical protein